MKIWVDGRELDVERDVLLYDAMVSAGVEVPALCRHGGLPHEGTCRVCMVEVDIRGKRRLVASCMYPVRDQGLKVYTSTRRVEVARRFVIGLLLRRNPASPAIRALADRWGAMDTSRLSPVEGKDLCIRCGRCVRACATFGARAISFANRGWDREVCTPLKEPTLICVGCLSCAEVCPTGHITYRESQGERQIWGRTFHLVRCSRCGDPFATREQLELVRDRGDVCPRCLREEEGLALRDG